MRAGGGIGAGSRAKQRYSGIAWRAAARQCVKLGKRGGKA